MSRFENSQLFKNQSLHLTQLAIHIQRYAFLDDSQSERISLTLVTLLAVFIFD